MDNLIGMEKMLAELDFHFAKARYAVKIQAVEPNISIDKIIKIDLMRHPLLIGRVEKIVENDFEIGKGYKSIIITGSNTGGKTVTLKTVGLFILMMKSGLFLPCAEAHIYPFEKVLADIGDEQSILQNLSTFSSHMKNVIEILNLADSDTFVLIDELCAGTDPQEGATLAEVILKELIKKQAQSIITTHYGELKTLEYTNQYFKNASVEFDTESLSPTYKLVIGIPGLSNAISIAANLGLDKDLVWEAKELLITQRDTSSIVVERLQDTQQKLDTNLREAETLNTEAAELKKYYEKELNEQKKEKKKNLKNIKDKFESQLENAKDTIKEILTELRQEKSEKIARRSYARLAKLEQGFRDDMHKMEEKEQYLELDWSLVKPKDKVMIKELNQPVIVLSLPDKNDSLYKAVGNIYKVNFFDSLSKLNKPVDKTKWLMPGHMVNACYDPSKNDITFPAAILQAPFYSLKQTRSENLGGIGAVIGHEISHAFDNNGAKMDENGNINNWWTKEDFKKFAKKTKDMIKQFDGIELPAGKVNSALIVSENIADNGGMAVTLHIMKKMKDANYEQYFINWARIWCTKAKPEYEALLLTVDVHGPVVLRTNMPPRNFEEWYQTFNVKKTDKMYIAPNKRLVIW